MRSVIMIVVLLLAATALVLWAAGSVDEVLGTGFDSPTLLASAALFVILLSSLVRNWRASGGQALQYTAIWIALFLALVLGYSYRNDLKPLWQRVAGEVNPALPQQRSAGEVVLRRAADGHFYADVEINGQTIRMLVDTGATTIALSADDARRAGIDVDRLDFIFTVSTANGEATAAEVKLDAVSVGPIARRNVRAMVTRGLSGSLLGMSFFNSLSTFAIETDELVLRD